MIGIIITFMFYNFLALWQGPCIYPFFFAGTTMSISWQVLFFLLTKTRSVRLIGVE